jgi:hypothetical protein
VKLVLFPVNIVPADKGGDGVAGVGRGTAEAAHNGTGPGGRTRGKIGVEERLAIDRKRTHTIFGKELVQPVTDRNNLIVSALGRSENAENGSEIATNTGNIGGDFTVIVDMRFDLGPKQTPLGDDLIGFRHIRYPPFMRMRVIYNIIFISLLNMEISWF